MNKVQVPPPDHVTFDKQGRAHADDDALADLAVGRVNYSPDYRLVTEVALTCPNCGNPDCAEAEEFKAKIIKLQCERTRLERSVIEKAKKELAASDAPKMFESLANQMYAIRELRAATRALLEFESKQK